MQLIGQSLRAEAPSASLPANVLTASSMQEGIQHGYVAMNMETPAPSLPGNQPSAPRVPTSAIARLLVLKSMYSRPLMI